MVRSIATKMANTVLFMAALSLALSTSTKELIVAAASPTLTRATPNVNLSHLLATTGPFSTFLTYLKSTKVINTFQNQISNNSHSHQGITLFVPTDTAFASLKPRYLKSLTTDQLKSLFLSHALPKFYSISDFKRLGELGPARTFAGGHYTILNFKVDLGVIHIISSGRSKTKIKTSVFCTSPVAVYEIGRVLLPVNHPCTTSFGSNLSSFGSLDHHQ